MEHPSIALMRPGRVIISVWNGRAAVSRYEARGANEIVVVEAQNWQDLEAEAEAEVYEQGGALNFSGHYTCSPHLAEHARFEPESEILAYDGMYEVEGRRRAIEQGIESED
jgi:hypothetical protein